MLALLLLKRIQKFKETGNAKYIYKNELDKASFWHDMADGNFEGLARRTAFDKVFRNKEFSIAKNPKKWLISKRSCFYAL